MDIGNEQFKHERLQAIIADHKSGAAELARVALQALADYSQLCEQDSSESYKNDVVLFAEALQQARPNMASLVNLVGAWCDWLSNELEQSLPALRQIALDTSHDLISQSTEAKSVAAQNILDLVKDESVVLTHSYSSTVVECFRELVSKNISAIISESRPGHEGIEIAKVLANLAITAEYITDSQLGLFVQRADVVIVGADTILADGFVINKAGTSLLALAAKQAGIPFYICAESFKLSKQSKDEIRLEEMDASELGLPQLPHIKARNIYFDITPPELVTAWINEHGVKQLC